MFRVAGQFAEAAAIPTATLGLFAGVSRRRRARRPLALETGPETAARRPARRGTPRTPRPPAPPRPRVRRRVDTPGGDPAVPPRLCPPRRPGVRGLHHAGGLRPGRRCRRAPTRLSRPPWTSPRSRRRRPGAPLVDCSGCSNGKPIISGNGTPSSRPSRLRPASPLSGPYPRVRDPRRPGRSSGSASSPSLPLSSAGGPSVNPPPSCESSPGIKVG